MQSRSARDPEEVRTNIRPRGMRVLSSANLLSRALLRKRAKAVLKRI